MRKGRIVWIVLGTLAIAGSVFWWHPVCLPISQAELMTFTVPIEQRIPRSKMILTQCDRQD
jgi:hypothetical protein